MSHADKSVDIAAAAHPYRWAMLAGVWLAYFGFGLTVASMAPLVGAITLDMGLSYSVMGAVLGAWQLIYIGSAIPSGAFLDRVGAWRAIFIGVVTVAGSGALRALALGDVSLFLAVALFGLGGPLISIGAPKVVSKWFEGPERGMAMGIYMAGMALGSISGLSLTNSVMMPLTGGDWRAVLLSYAGLVLLCGLLWLAIGAHPAARAVERRAAQDRGRPQLQVFAELVRMAPVRIVLIMSIGIFIFNHGLNNWLPEILRDGGMSAARAGFWAAIPVGVGLIGAVAIPRFATPGQRLPILLALFLCAGAASLLLHAAAGPLLAAGLVLQGVAQSSMMTIVILVLVEVRGLAAENRGLAVGLFFAAAEIGGVMGPLSIGVLSDLTGGFTAPLGLLTAVCAALVALVIKLRRMDQ